MDETQAQRLVFELWQRVDGGFCNCCTQDALDALRAVFPEVNWDAHWKIVEEDTLRWVDLSPPDSTPF